MRLLLVVSILLFLAALAGAEDSLRFGHFAESGLEGWQHKRFQGETEYRIVDDGGQKVLQATSRAAASGLVYKTTYQPATYPVLTWRWKVDRVIAKGDSRTKAGDDYAARVYVVFPHWFFPKTRTLNYLWANRLPVGTVQPNAFTSNAMMIAVESGPGRVGQWVTERRNIVDDYRRAFGEDPPAVGAIAIMTDTDNTAESATAWYAEIKALRR